MTINNDASVEYAESNMCTISCTDVLYTRELVKH